MDLTNIIEKIIKLRINDIIKKSELDEKTENKIREINENIAKNNKQNRKIIKTSKVEKKDRKLIAYTVYIKDANNVIKNNPTLNYLPQKNITQINKVKHEKDNKNRMKELSKIWKNIDDLTINKYKDLTKDKNFTNENYNNLIKKPLTPKVPRKKKSKESLKNNI
jgi:predicted GTPase